MVRFPALAGVSVTAYRVGNNDLIECCQRRQNEGSRLDKLVNPELFGCGKKGEETGYDGTDL